MSDFVEIKLKSIRVCKPTEEWHWKILEYNYVKEFQWIRRAFIGKMAGSDLPDWDIYYGKYRAADRGASWEEVEIGARTIAAALAKKLSQGGRHIPYVNTLWLV